MRTSCLLPSHTPDFHNDEMAGVYLQLVASVAKLYLGTSGYYTKAPAEKSPLAMAHLKAGLPEESSDFAVFWPFASLPPSQQQPWSNESAAWFRHAICWILPGDDGGGDVTAASSQPLAYATSGTCAVEAAISALANTGLRRLDLTKRTPDAMRKAYSGHDWAPADRLDRVCASWLPPRSPESFARFVEGKSFRDCCREGDGHGGGMEGMGDDDNDDNAAKAAASADAARACAVEAYRAAFDDATRAVHSLDFSRLGWSATELDELFLSLPRFTCLMQLNLSRNTFDGNAVRSFAHAWPNGVVKARPLRASSVVVRARGRGRRRAGTWRRSSPALADRTQSRRQLHHKRGRPVHRRRADKRRVMCAAETQPGDQRDSHRRS